LAKITILESLCNNSPQKYYLFLVYYFILLHSTKLRIPKWGTT